MVLLKKKFFITPKRNFNFGFKIVELIVSVAIMVVISAVIFWNGNKFNDKIEINSAAEEVSLAIREAQNYGISVRESSAGTGQFNFGYGVTFDTANVNPTFILIFADRNGNKIYDDDNGIPCDGSSGDECVEKIPLRNGVSINSMCAIGSLGVLRCGVWKSIQIIFIRPNLDATINTVNSSSLVLGPWPGGRIVLQSRQGALRTVSVNFTGQISVQ